MIDPLLALGLVLGTAFGVTLGGAFFVPLSYRRARVAEVDRTEEALLRYAQACRYVAGRTIDPSAKTALEALAEGMSRGEG